MSEDGKFRKRCCQQEDFYCACKSYIPTIFEEKCMHCGSAEELFHELSTLQEELMTEALEARQGRLPGRSARQSSMFTNIMRKILHWKKYVTMWVSV